jgi:hypothetical protein
MPTRRSSITRLAKAAVLATIALVTVPAAASAAVCPDQQSTQALSQFGDYNDYFLAPGGDFEGPAGAWSGGRGVDRVDANKPWALAGPKALGLGKGKVTTSPDFCVSELHPHLRFMAASKDSDGILQVEAMEGSVTTALVTVPATGSWQLTDIVPLATALGYVGDDGHNVKLRFTSLKGEWAVDGVYIDPYRR